MNMGKASRKTAPKPCAGIAAPSERAIHPPSAIWRICWTKRAKPSGRNTGITARQTTAATKNSPTPNSYCGKTPRPAPPFSNCCAKPPRPASTPAKTRKHKPLPCCNGFRLPNRPPKGSLKPRAAKPKYKTPTRTAFRLPNAFHLPSRRVAAYHEQG